MRVGGNARSTPEDRFAMQARTAAAPDFSARSIAPSSDKSEDVSAQPVMANFNRVELTLSLGSSAKLCESVVVPTC